MLVLLFFYKVLDIVPITIIDPLKYNGSTCILDCDMHLNVDSCHNFHPCFVL